LIFLITPWNVTEILQVTLDRLLMHVVPIAGLIACLHWSEIRQGQ
jgi:hypothetical protein